MVSETADVVICGAGPVGLIVALGLAQQGIDTVIIERRERQVQESFGRACTLYPRTLELLEQVDVAGDVVQAAFTGKSYAVYKDGKRQIRQTWQCFLPYMESSFHGYITNIRQKKSEDIFVSKYKTDHGKDVHYGWELLGQELNTELADGYNITVSVSHALHGQKQIRCKYLIGADGGRSTVRELSDIPMQGNDTTHRWVRIDGLMKTNIPEPNLMFASLETKTHGNVLWLRLDNDAHRIGYALTPRLQEKYPNGPTQEEAIAEAKEALQPFDLHVERLDWWTCYSIKQKVAATMQKNEFILLAGDAAHTHSSAFAQGMNTAVHDATNLVWKLSGTLKGWYKKEVLETYNDERRSAAQKLISIDQQAAAVISGNTPAEFQALGLSAEDAMRSIFQENMTFTVGLGIRYGPSILSGDPLAGTLVPGMRGPDALLYAPGPAVPLRLHDIVHRQSTGRWSLLVFAGHAHCTRQHVAALRATINTDESKTRTWSRICHISTIMVGITGCPWDAFDGPAVGNLYFDKDSHVHDRYGVYPEHGAIAVIRPDGIFAFAAPLTEVDKVGDYFDGFCV